MSTLDSVELILVNFDIRQFFAVKLWKLCFDPTEAEIADFQENSQGNFGDERILTGGGAATKLGNKRGFRHLRPKASSIFGVRKITTRETRYKTDGTYLFLTV